MGETAGYGLRLRADTGLSVEILIDRLNTVHQANEGTQEQEEIEKDYSPQDASGPHLLSAVKLSNHELEDVRNR